MKSSKDFWELRAKEFDEKAVGFLLDPYCDKQENKLRWIAIKKGLKLKMGQRALEVGCGTGNFAIKLAKRGLTVSANDISPTLVNIAREKAMENDVDIDFFNCKIKDLSLPRNAFDLVLSVTVFQHIIEIEDFRKSINKIVSLTKPGSTIAILEYSPDRLSKSYEQRLLDADLMMSRTKNEWIGEFERGGAIFRKEVAVRFRFSYFHFLGGLYRDGKPLVIYLRDRIREKLQIFGKSPSSDCSVVTRWMIYVLTTLIGYLLVQIPFFYKKADIRLLIFKKV